MFKKLVLITLLFSPINACNSIFDAEWIEREVGRINSGVLLQRTVDDPVRQDQVLRLNELATHIRNHPGILINHQHVYSTIVVMFFQLYADHAAESFHNYVFSLDPNTHGEAMIRVCYVLYQYRQRSLAILRLHDLIHYPNLDSFVLSEANKMLRFINPDGI